MVRIALLLLAGVIPVLAQYQNYQRNRFTDYGDYSGYSTSGSSEQQQQRNDFGVQQRSFFPSHYNNNNRAQQQVGNNFGASGISAPANNVNNNNNNNYFGRDRHAIVPSSLRELEESYIRSLSSSSSTTQPFLDPYSENRQTLPPQLAQGVENYSGFIANRQQFTHSHYNKNEQNPFVQQKQQVLQQQNNGNQAQSAPITYGIPLLNQQISASNSIEAQYGQKDQFNGKYYDYHQKSNVVPNFPDFSDRPPIPEEPYIPDENEGYGQAPHKLVRPTASDVRGFGAKVNQPPIASPPSIFDPSFPEPVLQRGFIPSFGPPTKEPCKPVPLQETPGLEEQGYNHLSQQSDVPASIIPILRPEYPKDKDEYVLPDEASSDTPEEQESTRKGKVYKHISVHVPAEDLDEEVSAPKVVKVTKKPEKHLKVIFIKPPDTPTPKTEVEVSPTPQHKTLVYLLSQSGGTRTPIKLVSPTPFKPTPPQVYFLRYKDPNTGASHPQPSSESEPSESESASGSGSSEREVEPTTPNPPVIKDLQSQLDPDAELLRSAPLPVIPTSAYTTFSSPGTTAFSNLAAQTTLSSPTIFTNYNTNPTFGTVAPSQISINNGNNHLDALQFNTNTFPSLQAHTNNNPLSPNYFSSIYHLYPPPTVTGASIPSQNLVSMYLNPLHQQYHHPQYQQLYQLDQSKSGTEQKSTALQGLYNVASYAQNLRGINLNSLVQNSDGKSRTPRNFVMMNYAPTYMPSASASDHAPVFSSPAEFIKSLLGDSYMFYSNIGNNNNTFLMLNSNHTSSNSDSNAAPSSSTPTINQQQLLEEQNSTTSKVNHEDPPSPPSPPPNTLPLISQWENLQNISNPTFSQQLMPYKFLLANSYGAVQNGREIFQNPLHTQFPILPAIAATPTTITTTTSTHQPRMSSPILTKLPPPTSQQIVQLPVIIYDSQKYNNISRENLTTADSVSSQFNKLFQATTSLQVSGNSSEVASYSESGSGSEELNGGDEEGIQIYAKGAAANNSSIVYHRNNNESKSSRRGSRRSGSRRRVNPANVKPGTRLRKVRKPSKSKSKDGNGNEQQNKSQS